MRSAAFSRAQRPITIPACLLLVALAAPASAATFMVNTLNDSVDANPGDGIAADANGFTSLRAAVMELNALIAAGDPGPHLIEFQPCNPPAFPCPAVYTLSLLGPGEDGAATGDLDILGAALGGVIAQITIRGNSAVDTVISANPLPLPPQPLLDRAFEVIGGIVRFERITIRNGHAVQPNNDGGGVHVRYGNVTLNDVIVSSCVADRNGGGIACPQPLPATTTELVLFSTTVEANAARNGSGGGIFIGSDPVVSIIDSFIFANTAMGDRGGGIANSFSSLTMPLVRTRLSNTLIMKNTAALAGGAHFAGKTDVNRCTVNSNQAIGPPLGALLGTAGGGIVASERILITRTLISTNRAQTGAGLIEDSGGGLAIDLLGTVELHECSFVQNSAGGLPGTGQGGAIANFGQLLATNTTISNNFAMNRGGGIYTFFAFASTVFNFCTVAENYADNAGGGIYHDGQSPIATFTAFNTLIARNVRRDPAFPPLPFPSPNTVPNNANFGAGGPPLGIITAEHCLDDDGTCNLIGAGNLILVPSGLGSLTTCPGGLPVHELLLGSPAVNAANVTCSDHAGTIITLDQCSNLRAQGPACDIGAFELAGGAGPSNDVCANAAPIGLGLTTWINLNATPDGPLDPACGWVGTNSDIWFEFIPPCTGTVTYTLTGVTLDALLTVYDGGCPQAGFPSAGCVFAPVGVSISLSIQAVAGQTYVLRIAGVGASQGLGEIDITCASSCGPCQVNLNNDPGRLVNAADLAILLGSWSTPPGSPGCGGAIPCCADLNGDGLVNAADLGILLGAWSTPPGTPSPACP